MLFTVGMLLATDKWTESIASVVLLIMAALAALCNRAGHYILPCSFFMAALCNRGPLYFCPVVSIFYLLSIFLFFSSPNLSGRRLDVYHTLVAHGVALVRI